jgi:hypothetical protein
MVGVVIKDNTPSRYMVFFVMVEPIRIVYETRFYPSGRANWGTGGNGKVPRKYRKEAKEKMWKLVGSR